MGEKNGETETERDRERMEIEKTITVFQNGDKLFFGFDSIFSPSELA